jgi:hypothetical protein
MESGVLHMTEALERRTRLLEEQTMPGSLALGMLIRAN